MGEQRYKVGDWVRVIDNRGAPTDYKKDDVCQVTAVRDDLVFSNKKPGMFAKRFEPWQPRVGERVRYCGKSAVYSERELVGLEGEVTELNGNLVNVKWDKTIVDGIRTGGAKYIENLEPNLSTETPAKSVTLKIEAGKFYKTRDGRKVGPMVEDKWHDRRYGWTVAHEFNAEYGKAWRGDGTFHPDVGTQHGADLIAEWIDEPAAKASNDNTTPKFKVGDIVKRSRGFMPHQRLRITKAEGERYSVEWLVGGPGSIDTWRGYEFELVTPAPTPISIVALIESGLPKPSSTPHVHTSTGAAEKEAKRLAAKYKGQQFGVFTLTTTHEESAPVYDHKWQNMAYLGLKIDAIKELRAVAGLTLKGAKDAVEAWIEYENAA
ncbi:hypothetical protein J5288_09495 [Agrobacterium sp. S2/73]|uniref:hypothetical protein n=1 Tax=unclassified Agrobacterium TaxID=2632611 RepID=UPI001ADAC4B2|nr:MULTISPECIES: hypothetical protein [unclassified Agrobacterium]MBO9108938.1 hypothetical protein [Agrobacterium sp. S2/73]QXZ73312.1 hypothetical protein J5276_05015 [Agrobacterium sp. S7/73]